jgi:hypothetical protein
MKISLVDDYEKSDICVTISGFEGTGDRIVFNFPTYCAHRINGIIAFYAY